MALKIGNIFILVEHEPNKYDIGALAHYQAGKQ